MKGIGVEEIIRKRYSCRSYKNISLSEKDLADIKEFISGEFTGPFGSSSRFKIFASEPADSTALKGLGTYGFIKNPAAFIAGVVNESEVRFEDFGYSMEKIILHITESGLGSCWLGGSFNKSNFAAKAGVVGNELVPAVAALGYQTDKKTVTDRVVRAAIGSSKRKERNEVFFSSSIGEPDIKYEEGYGIALEMLRLAPSASNKQPWRVVKMEGKNVFHFFLERTAGYNRQIKLIGGADLQKIDMGIAMYHFESTAIDSGLKGEWKIEQQADFKIPKGWEYTITWDGE